ncbi:MAG: ornithine cyclodeaminase, partial [Pseudomonadota bacterium]
MKVLSASDVAHLVTEVGVQPFLARLVERMARDFRNWEQFHLSPRHATRVTDGIIELMPCANGSLYSFKFVNGHPGNVKRGIPSIIAFGVVAEVATGRPLMLAEMALLTALRTAATAALGARYLARPDSAAMGIIGTGAQAE